MCGRFTLRRDVHAVARELNAYGTGGSVIFEPRYNIAPTQQSPILTVTESGRQLSPMVWGIPRGRSGKMVRQINARAEALPARSLRCAVVTDGFYEWAGAKGAAGQPYFFHREDDGLILMAGLWQWHKDEQGFMQTFAIVTTAANGLMAPVHDRMPAILEGDSLALWLKADTSAEELPDLLGPARDDLLIARPISSLINNAKNDRPELISRSDNNGVRQDAFDFPGARRP